LVFCVAILPVLLNVDVLRQRNEQGETQRLGIAGILSVDAQSLLLLNWLCVAVGGMVLLSTVTTVGFQARYMITATVPLFVLVAKGVTTLDSRSVILGFTALTVILAAPGLADYYTTPDNEEWREATQYVETQTEPGDLILFNAGGPGVRGSFDFYFDGESRVRRGFPNETREINKTRLDRLPQIVDGYNRVVVVLSHSRDCNGDIARRLSEEYNLTDRAVFKNIDVYVFNKTAPQRVEIPDHPDRGALISC